VRARIPDPNDAATYQASIPDPAEAATPPHAEILQLHKTLLQLRARHITPGMPHCRSLGAHAVGDGAVQAAWRLGTGAILTLQSNFAKSPAAMPTPPGALLFTSAPAATPALPAACTRAFLDNAP
jgi:maltooligosyltrehalose trehalohydrolase